MTTNFEAHLTEPALLAPNLVENIWGGDWLPRLKNLPPTGKPIGESWEFSAHADHPGELVLKEGQRLGIAALFSKRPAGLLIKLIDAHDNLSLQVHPADDYARRHEQSPGKAESWLVLGVGNKPGDGFIYLGFSEKKRRTYKTDREFSAAFEQACRSGQEADVLSFVNKIRVRPGDAFHVLPGTVHAVGRGVTFFEVQQSSGLTYRLWDWNRGSRELHWKKALQVLDFSAKTVRVDKPDRLVDPAGHYEAAVMTTKTGFNIPPPDGFYVLTVLDGEMDLNPGPKKIHAGQSVFVPGKLGVSVTTRGKDALRVVRSWTTEPPLSSGSQ